MNYLKFAETSQEAIEDFRQLANTREKIEVDRKSLINQVLEKPL